METPDPKILSQFLQASGEGNLPLVTTLLQNNGQSLLNTTDKQGWNALMYAAEGLHVDLISFLLDQGADPHHKTNDSMTVLHVLGEIRQEINNYNIQVVKGIWKIFLEYGVPMEERNETGETAFHLVCLRGDVDMVLFLLRGGYVPNVNVTNSHGETPLHYASRVGLNQIVNILMKNGADPTIVSQFGTALQVAEKTQKHKIRELLISLKSQTNLFTIGGDCLTLIFGFLGTPQDLCSLSMVCKVFSMISRSDILWKPLGYPYWEESDPKKQKPWKELYLSWLRQYISRASSPKFVKNNENIIFKILLQGDSSAGKSSLLLRYVNGIFHNQFISTIGVDFKIKHVEHRGINIKLQIWDIAGPERFRSISQAYYRGSSVVILVFDLNNDLSFSSIPRWIEEVNRADPQPPPLLFLVGSKSDLEHTVSFETVQNFLKENPRFICYKEVSSKTGENVEELFECITRDLLNQLELPNYVPSFEVVAQQTSKKTEQPLSINTCVTQ